MVTCRDFNSVTQWDSDFNAAILLSIYNQTTIENLLQFQDL